MLQNEDHQRAPLMAPATAYTTYPHVPKTNASCRYMRWAMRPALIMEVKGGQGSWAPSSGQRPGDGAVKTSD